MNQISVPVLAFMLAAIAASAPRAVAQPARQPGLRAADIYQLRSVGDVQISPDGQTIVYAVVNNDRPDRPYSQVWQLTVATGQTRRVLGDNERATEPRFSPDGRRLAYVGELADRSGLVVANADGSSPRVIAPVESTNHPLPSSGDCLAWSPDGTRLAFVSAVPGPEADANGDPMVITRYSVQAHGVGRRHARERQSPIAHLRGRRRSRDGPAVDQRRLLRALDRMVT